MCESKSIILFVMVCSNPFSTLIAMISVATPRAIPMIEIVEIKEINRESFLESINCFAIYQDTLIIQIIKSRIINFNLINQKITETS